MCGPLRLELPKDLHYAGRIDHRLRLFTRIAVGNDGSVEEYAQGMSSASTSSIVAAYSFLPPLPPVTLLIPHSTVTLFPDRRSMSPRSSRLAIRFARSPPFFDTHTPRCV